MITRTRILAFVAAVTVVIVTWQFVKTGGEFEIGFALGGLAVGVLWLVSEAVTGMMLSEEG